MHPSRIALALLLAGGLASAPLAAHARPKTYGQSPAAPKAAESTPPAGQVLDRQLSNLEREFVPAAEAMPEEKFNFAPSGGEFKGVKTFAEQVRHVASANFMFGAGIAGEKAPADLGGENGPENLKTKAEIVKYLKDSFAYVHKALAGVTDANATAPIPSPFGQGKATRLGLSTLTVAHGFDHYGQMAVYLRMNDIIPPASRQQ